MNRRLLALFLVPLTLTSGYVLSSFDHRWRGEWNWTFDTITGSTVLTGPLIAAMGAWLAMQARQLGSVTEATPRSWAVSWRVAFELWLIGLASYALTIIVAVSVTGLSVHGGTKEVWALAIGPLVLAMCTAAGVLAGTLAPYRLTSIIIGLAVFLFGAFGPSPVANLLRHGPTTGSLAGLRYDPAVWSGQAAAILGITGLILAALLLPNRGRVRPLLLATGITGLILSSVGIAVVLDTGSERFKISTESATACAGTAPTVCLAPSNRFLLSQTAAGLQRGAERLRAKGLTPPSRYEQLLPGYRPAEGSGMITRLPFYTSSDDQSWIWTSLLTPGACTFWTDPSHAPPDAVFESQALLEAWVVKGNAAGGTAWSPEARRWLASSDSPGALAWAQRTFHALEACELSQISLPYGQE